MKEPLYKRTWFIILWLVLFFPVGLVILWVSKKWSTVTRSVITIVIILLAIIGFGTSPDTSTSANTDEVKSEDKAEPSAAKAETKEDDAAKEAEKQKEAEAKAAEEKAAKEKEEEQAAKEKAEKEKAEKAEAKKKVEPSLEETITKAINKAAGKESNMDEKRIKELKINDNAGTEAADDKIVIASLRADDNFSEGYIKGGIEDDSSQIFKKLFENEEVSNVVLDWYYPLVDQYGNEEESVINTIGMTRETFDKINWNNFNRDNYPNVADDYFIHPVLNK
ncbi:hypothetical protein AB1K91_02570 [Terribacillus sp. 179-K 1B1 HS]|uniref:hypothetical protein n=1 Tax=Terribacillus sp. 179-K 1B1 HS TaxID=3142388 RepID=UPI0039A040C8